ncbi:MAG TPA: HAMP domain-containing protein [Anaerolineae bacterium]|nr:HAMP domain-containing protein [Anaerolineae bacterium]
MSVSTQEQPSKDLNRAKNIQRIAILFTVLALLNTGVQISAFIPGRAWQPMAAVFVTAGVALGNFFFVRKLAQTGRIQLAANLLLGIPFIAFLLLNTLISGLAIPFAVASVIFFPAMAFLTMPREQIKWAALMGLVLAALITAVNYFEPLPRFTSARPRGGPAVIVPVLLGVLIAFVVWQAVQLFVAGSLRTKLLIAFLVASLTPVVVMGAFYYKETGQTGGVLYAGAGLVILAIASAVFFAYIIAQPIRRLTDVAHTVAEGNLNVTAPIETQDEIGDMAKSFNIMTARLRELIGSLEDQVITRTAQLETVLEVNQRLTTILDVDELMVQVVDLVKSTFNYYHAHIYLLDETETLLIMRAGAGEAGRRMKEQGHYIPLAAERSLVARAARSKRAILISNVKQEPNWLPNPLLPETQSELAIPITFGAKNAIMGVLDVQQNQVGGLTRDDVQLLTSLTHQIAIAARNAQLYQDSQKALQEAQAIQRQYQQEAWESFVPTQPKTFFEAGQAPPAVSNLELQATSLQLPLSVRGQKVGVLGIAPPDGATSWNDDELALIEAVSQQVSLTIENLRLFETTKQRAAREQLTRKITDKIRASSTIENAMRTAAEELSRALGTARATVDLNVEAVEAK